MRITEGGKKQIVGAKRIHEVFNNSKVDKPDVNQGINGWKHRFRFLPCPS